MKNKIKDNFKAVDFMRSARKRLTELYQKDREEFLNELSDATNDFFELRKKLKSSFDPLAVAEPKSHYGKKK